MPAVVRVKRRIDEEPLNAFVLNGKRRRLNTENLSAAGGALSDERYRAEEKDEITTLLKFAGTIKEQDDTATKKFVRLTKEEALSRLTKEEAEELVKFRNTQRKASTVVEQSRREARRCMRENRFRIVNCMRKSLNENEDETVDDEQAAASNSNVQKLTILDIEKQNEREDDDFDDITASSSSATVAATALSQFRPNAAAMRLSENPEQPSDSDTGYVYDLYLPDNEEEDYADVMDDNHLSIEAFKGEFYEDIYGNDDEPSDMDEDSNDENYYKNDYPEDEDIDEEYSDYETNTDFTSSGRAENELCKAITKFVIKDNDDDDEEVDEAEAYGYNDYSDSDGDSDYYNSNPYAYNEDDDSTAGELSASSDEDATGYIHTVKVKPNAHFVNDIDVIAANDDFDKDDFSDYGEHNSKNMNESGNKSTNDKTVEENNM